MGVTACGELAAAPLASNGQQQWIRSRRCATTIADRADGDRRVDRVITITSEYAAATLKDGRVK